MEFFAYIPVLLGLLLLVSAFFSASETALFSLEPWQLEKAAKRGGFASDSLLWCHSHARTVLLSILFTNLGVNTFYFALIAWWSRDTGTEGAIYRSLGGFFALIFLAEILPKSLAMGTAESFALRSATWLRVWTRLLTPFTIPVLFLFRLVTHRLRFRETPDAGLSEEEVLEHVRIHPERFGLGPRMAQVVSEIVDLSDVQVRELMNPLVDIRRLPPATQVGDALTQVLPSGQTFALIGDERDTLAYVDARDLLVADPEERLRSLMRPMPVIPETARLHHLLGLYKSTGADLLLVVDEYGVGVGLIGWEDLLEEMIGDLVRSELDADELPLTPKPGGGWVVQGTISLTDFAELLGVRLPASRSRTLGGWFVDQLGHLPEVGESLTAGGLRLEALEMAKGHLRRLGVQRLEGQGLHEQGLREQGRGEQDS